MHSFAVYNRSILPFEQIRLPVFSNAALYGKGIFTTLAIYNRKPFLWEKHWRRLTANAAQISLGLGNLTEETIKSALFEIVEKNDFKNGRARITIFDESDSSVWQNDPISRTGFSIQTADFRPPKNIFKLTVSPFQINSTAPLAGVKSCNYLENILALENARSKNFDEAVRINERGAIASACMANIFWKRAGKIFTPPLETGCLAGTTREFVLENFPVEEIAAELNELKNADEIFLTSAGIGIVKAKFSDA